MLPKILDVTFVNCSVPWLARWYMEAGAESPSSLIWPLVTELLRIDRHLVSEKKHPRARILREDLGSSSIRGVFALPLTKLDASSSALHTAQCGSTGL